MIVIYFLISWFYWWLWLNTIGRVPQGLSSFSILLFDLSLIFMGYFIWKRSKVKPLFRPSILPENRAKVRFDLFNLPAWIALGSAIFYCLLIQPIDWDGLDYHLPPLLEALQKKQWGASQDPYYAVQAYPLLIESLYLYWIAHFSHHFYLCLGLLPIALGGWSVVRLAARYRLSQRTALLLWLTLPILMKQASSLYIDHFVGSFGMVACLGLVAGDPVLFALGLGFFMGAKLSSLIPGCILAVGWMVRHRRIPWLAVGLVLITLGTTLVQNWVRFNNPVYPFQVVLFGKSIFPGLFVPQQFMAGMPLQNLPWVNRILRALFSAELIPSWDMVEGALGPVLGVCLSFSAVSGTWAWIYSAGKLTFVGGPGRFRRFPVVEALIGLIFASALWMFRYHLWVLSGLILWATWGFHRMPRALRSLVWIFLCVQSVWIWSDRIWFLGKAPEWRKVLASRDLAEAFHLVRARAKELWEFGEPQIAANQVDQDRILRRKIRNQVYSFCGKRPQQLAAYYGADFSNRIFFQAPPCPQKKTSRTINH